MTDTKKGAPFIKERALSLMTADPLEFPSAWLTQEVFEALDAIDPPHKRLKKTTVLRLAEGEATGVPKRDILGMSDTCNVRTWYGHESSDQPGWQNDEKIAHALEVATRRANWWYDYREGQAIAERQRLVSRAQSEIAKLTIPALQQLAHLIEEASSERIKLDAVIEVLDRADATTAKKAQHEVALGMGDTAAITMRDIRGRRRRRDRIEDDGEVVDVLPEQVERREEELPIPLEQVILGMPKPEPKQVDDEEDDGDLGD